MNSELVYIIAEAGVNHNGSMDLARQLINYAAEAGADAVKFQSFKAENLVSCFAPKADYQNRNTSSRSTQLEMIKPLELSEENCQSLFGYCAEKHTQFLSTPFDGESMDFLVGVLNVPVLKISSGEITNAPFLLCRGRDLLFDYFFQ